MFNDFHGQNESKNTLCLYVGFPQEGLDVPLWRRQLHGAERLRVFQEYGWRHDMERSQRFYGEGTPCEAMGPPCGGCCSFPSADGVLFCRVRSSEQWPLSLDRKSV